MTRFLERLRSLFFPICPHCQGDGGHMSGYYEPEFSECGCCNDDGSNEAEPTRVSRWRLWRYNRWLRAQEKYWEHLCDEGDYDPPQD